ncbi:MAG: NUDIX domain-containing protein [Candidatus Latescibacteria bacterium]|nr:NUDIX domain-containing protein [Candidatus Latescibacterota bacterium]
MTALAGFFLSASVGMQPAPRIGSCQPEGLKPVNRPAQREALEETGYHTICHEQVYCYYPMTGIANKKIYIIHCRAVERVQDFDKNEVDEVRWFSREEIEQMVRDKVVTCGLSLTALLLYLK